MGAASNTRSSRRGLEQTDRVRDPRRDPRQPRDQFLAGAHEFRDGHGRQAIDDEPEIPAVLIQRRAFALAPIPPAASDALIVPPHNLSGIGMFDYRRAIANRIERLVLARPTRGGKAAIAIHIFAAEARAESDAQRVIQVDHRIDRGQAPALLHALPQRLHRAGRRFHNASTEQGVFFGLAPNARNAPRQASRCSIIQTGGCSGSIGIAAESAGWKSRTTTLNARYSGYRCQIPGSTMGRKFMPR